MSRGTGFVSGVPRTNDYCEDARDLSTLLDVNNNYTSIGDNNKR